MGRVLALRDPFGALSAAAQSMASADMGAAFTVTHSQDPNLPGAAPVAAGGSGCDAPVGQSRHVTRVTRCFYVDFFARHGSPQVNPLRQRPSLLYSDAGR